jgi:hypothetical protein
MSVRLHRKHDRAGEFAILPIGLGPIIALRYPGDRGERYCSPISPLLSVAHIYGIASAIESQMVKPQKETKKNRHQAMCHGIRGTPVYILCCALTLIHGHRTRKVPHPV